MAPAFTVFGKTGALTASESTPPPVAHAPAFAVVVGGGGVEDDGGASPGGGAPPEPFSLHPPDASAPMKSREMAAKEG